MDVLIAEWAIARLQIEGARQNTLGARREKHQDLKPELTPQKGGGASEYCLQAASNHLAEQDHSLTSADGVGPGATQTAGSTTVLIHGSYKCTSGKSSGRLFVTSLDVRFEQAVGSRDRWNINYEAIHRVEKVRKSDPIFQYLVSTH